MEKTTRRQSIQKIREEEERWSKKNRIDKSADYSIAGDIEIKAVYTPADLQGTDFLSEIGFPGEYPYTRGPYPEMYRHRPWRYSLFSGFGTAEDTQKRWKFLWDTGQRAFSVLPDLPTHMGLDSDNPRAEDEVGRVGLAIDTVEDFEILFSGLPLEEASFSCNEETLAAIIFAFVWVAMENLGMDPAKLRGAISNDPLAAVHKGTTVLNLQGGVRLAVDLIGFCVRNAPRYYPINLKAVNLREGGANPIQEVAYTFSNAICYIEKALERGMDIDDFAPKLSIFFASNIQILEEAAKYRAARRLWARMMKERFGAKAPKSCSLRFTAEANPNNMQAEEPELNLVRAACGAIASALGGAQGTPHPCYDEVYSIPTEKSHSLALGTVQILAEETNITRTVDPLAGSYYVEYLTNEIEKRVVEEMKKVEESGGAIKALESGYVSKTILSWFIEEQRAIQTGEKVIVRRNKYRLKNGENPWDYLQVHESDPEAVERQIKRLKEVRRRRDTQKWREALRDLRRAAEGSENMMPFIIEAARARASFGEITGVLKEVFGEYQDLNVI